MSSKLCDKGAGCENIYVWKGERQEFISLLNEDEPAAPEINDLGAFRGKTVRVIAGNIFPYITYCDRTKELGGFLGDMWNVVEEILGFTSNITTATYDDGLEIVSRGDADVMLSAVVPKEGLVNVEYSQPYFYNWYHIFLKRPNESPSSFSFVKTLNPNLWISSLALFAILTTSLWLTAKFLNSNYRLERNVSMASCFLTVVGGFMNQGFDTKLTSYSCRIQVISALLLGLLLYSAMNAVLVAKLAVVTDLPFSSLEEVAEKRTHSMCVRNETFVYNNFTDDRRNVLQKWRNIVNGPGCLNTNLAENLAKTICQENVLVLENKVVMSAILQYFRVPCEVAHLGARYFEKQNFFLMAKGLDRKKSILLAMDKLREGGVAKRFENKWIHRIRPHKNLAIVNFPQVTIQHVRGIMAVYFFMLTISLVILLIERNNAKVSWTRSTNRVNRYSPEKSSRNFSTP